jgi:hypothetical protein
LAVVIKLEVRAASRMIFNSPQMIRQTKAADDNYKGHLTFCAGKSGSH